MTDAPTVTIGLGPLRPAPAGLPDPAIDPPNVGESGDPFTAIRVIDLLARIERGRPVRLADIADRLNATLSRLAVPDPGHRRRRPPAAGQLDDRLPQQLGHRGRGRFERPASLTIEDSSRVDPWIVRQAQRAAADCTERLAEFSRRDRPSGD